MPHAPQFFASPFVSTHWVPHFSSPIAHSDWQIEFTQASPASHAWPQPPQFCASPEVSTQALPQAVCPVGHGVVGVGVGVHEPLAPQVVPDGQSAALEHVTVTVFPQLEIAGATTRSDASHAAKKKGRRDSFMVLSIARPTAHDARSAMIVSSRSEGPAEARRPGVRASRAPVGSRGDPTRLP